MLTILSMNRAGLSDGCLTFKVEFEFDNASTLPEKAFNVGNMSYVLAKGSTAKNVVTGINYEYSGSKWLKVTGTTNNTNTITSKITDNGDYNIVNNDFAGFSDVTVDVSGESPTLITKTITENNTYNASDDEADGYSSVTVNVAAPALTPETIGGIMSANVNYGTRDYSITFTEKTLAEANITAPNNSDGTYYIYNHVTTTLLVPAKYISVPALSTAGDLIIFTPADNFDGIYVNGTKYEPATTITPGDGKWYAYVGNSSYGVTYQGVNASGQDVNIRVVTT